MLEKKIMYNLIHINNGEYINLVTDTLKEQNHCIIIRNVCPASERIANLDCVGIQISDRLTQEQKENPLNTVINLSFKFVYGNDYWKTSDCDDELQEVVCINPLTPKPP